jgi:predicted lipid-binding transport protein (Tim44 family)
LQHCKYYTYMSYSFEYIDIILLAMIAGFIFLRLRGILGKKTGFEEDINSSFAHEAPPAKPSVNLNAQTFDENAKKDFVKGAKIAYETIITNFAKGKIKDIKSLLDKSVYQQFEEAIKDRDSKKLSSETTFIGINSAEIKEHIQNKNMLEVTVEFVSEIISCVKDKDNKVVSGDPERIKKVLDTWKFSKDSNSNNPNWLLIDTQA